MAGRTHGDSLRLLHSIIDFGVASGLTDRQLLERFATHRDEAGELAFEALVRRHGPMVLRTCRGILRDEHDAMDAFQATFLILARSSGSLWVRDSLGPWLRQVACRAARRAKAELIRHKTLKLRLAEMGGTSHRESGGGDLAAAIREEIDRLPERFRVPLVLCDLDGHTYEEASRQLEWSVGTVKSRLAEARRRLRLRLTRGGLAPSSAAIVARLADEAMTATKALPPGLPRATGQFAMRFLTGRTASANIPAAITRLTEGVLKSMFLATLKRSAAAFLLIVSFGLGLAGLITHIQAADPAEPLTRTAPQEQTPLGPPVPATLVGRYETSLAAYNRMKGRWHVVLEEPEPGENPGPQVVTQEWTVLRDHDRSRLLKTENRGNARTFYESVRQANQWVSVYLDGTIFGRTQVSAQSDMEELGMADPSPCYGIIDQKWIPTFLRTSKVSARAETLDGHAVYLLRGDTMDAEIDLWLDPLLDYAARRVRFEKRASADDPTVRTRQFDATRFRKQHGRYLVTEANITFTRGPQPLFSAMVVRKLVDGKRVETRPLARDKSGNVIMVPQSRYVQKMTLLDLDFEPTLTDRDFQFLRPIAEGSKVHMKDARDANYVWKDGKAVLIASDPIRSRPAKPVVANRGAGSVDAEERLRQARSKAKSQGKKLLVHVGAPVCGFCRVLEAFLDGNQRLFDDNYVMVKIDTETMDKGGDVAERLRKGRIEGGIPWITILDADGNELITSDRPDGSNIGCPILPDEIEYFLTMLRKTSTVTETRLAEIREALERHVKPHRDRLPVAFQTRY